MKKVLLCAFCFILLSISTAQASNIDWIEAASAGYLSTYSSPSILFNGRAGDSVALLMAPIDYSSTSGYCGLSRLDAPSTIIASGYGAYGLFGVLPADDMYIFLCIKASGLSGNVILAVIDPAVLAVSSADRSASAVAPPELTERLKAAIAEMFVEKSN